MLFDQKIYHVSVYISCKNAFVIAGNINIIDIIRTDLV